MKAHVLLVEDEENLRIALTDRLRKEGYTVDLLGEDDAVFEKIIPIGPFDIFIVNLTLPGRNALELCRNIRADGIEAPILLLMDHGAIEQTVIALKLGADAYLTKPFDVEELLARMEALLQRTPTGQDHVRHFGKVRVDLRSARVTCNGVPIRLTSREFQLLSYFIKNSGIALSREQILRDVWGYGAVAKTRTVDVHVASLRQKLEVDPRRPTLIRTATRIGYMFDIAE